jgi:hypothetical protein
MSRARSIHFNGEKHWFDTSINGAPAKPNHLELLAAVENIEIDDLLDEGLNQGEVIDRLRCSLGQGGTIVIPAEIVERQRQRREQAQTNRICRAHPGNEGCEGRITRHHFVTKWLMLELENYDSYSRRDKCTIPLCVGFHRDLHMRNSNTDKSIVRYLNDEDRQWAHKMLSELEEQHPKIIKLMRKGDPAVSYEAQLIRDYDAGLFDPSAQVDDSIISMDGNQGLDDWVIHFAK